MPQGIEIKNTTGSFQVTQNTQVFSFLRKGTVNTLPRSDPSDWVETSEYAEITGFDPLTEICAISSTEYISTLFYQKGKLYIGMEYIGETHNYPPVDYWVFGKPNTVSSQGVQVFDGQGTSASNLLYDSSWVPIKPYQLVDVPELGLPWGDLPTQHSVSLPSNKTFAYIPMVVHSISSRYVRELNQTGTVDQEWAISYYRRDDAAKITGNTFYVKPSEISYYRYDYMGYMRWRESNFDSDNNERTKYLLVDVTGL